mgnify:CR=1 FL=1
MRLVALFQVACTYCVLSLSAGYKENALLCWARMGYVQVDVLALFEYDAKTFTDVQAGKSTALNMLLGSLKPTGGQVFVHNQVRSRANLLLYAYRKCNTFRTDRLLGRRRLSHATASSLVLDIAHSPTSTCQNSLLARHLQLTPNYTEQRYVRVH